MEPKQPAGFIRRKYQSFKAASNEFCVRTLTSFTFTTGCALIGSGIGVGGFRGALISGGFWLAKAALKRDKEQNPSTAGLIGKYAGVGLAIAYTVTPAQMPTFERAQEESRVYHINLSGEARHTPALPKNVILSANPEIRLG